MARTRAPHGTSPLEKAWIPPGPKDVLEERIEVKSRLPSDPDFLKLPADSPLATAGIGGDLPSYVGAVPPDGAQPWDWNKVWRHDSKSSTILNAAT